MFWKIQDSKQIKNTDNTQIKYNSEEDSKTKLAWFSRLLRHSGRK